MSTRLKLILFHLFFVTSHPSTAIAIGNQDPTTLADQLDTLSIRNDFIILGLERTETHPPKRSRGKAQQQLKQLLSNFNYIMTHSIEGEVEKIIITGEKLVRQRGVIIDTERHGNHHMIKGFISGLNPDKIEVAFMIDTGADYIALPESMLEPLGIPASSLKQISLQTANGKITGNLGRLKSVEIGNEVIENVAAAFLPDKALNGTKLLGMNVLGRYQITLDNKQQTMTLINP